MVTLLSFVKDISRRKRCNFEMPIIWPPPYSEEIKLWSMYAIVDSKWQIQPPIEEDDTMLPPYTNAEAYDETSLPKYKKHTQGIHKRMCKELKKMITAVHIERQRQRQRNLEIEREIQQLLQESRYVTQLASIRRREARDVYTIL